MEDFVKRVGGSDTDHALLRDFCTKSSWGVPFLVLSTAARPLVGGLRRCDAEEEARLVQLAERFAFMCEADESAVIVDFEGEMPGGFGGELLSAAFLETQAVDGASLGPRPGAALSKSLGLLVDLRCEEGVALTRRIMQSERIAKMMWGAYGDVYSLLHQLQPVPLKTRPKRVVDAQLGFSDPSQRLGMGRMLKRLPAELLTGLPGKNVVDFDTPHSENKRALTTPLKVTNALYAIDDMHRIDAILVDQKPENGYLQALSATDESILACADDDSGMAWLREQESWLRKSKEDLRKACSAVGIARHIASLRSRGAALCPWTCEVEHTVQEILRERGVVIPEDLSFAD